MQSPPSPELGAPGNVPCVGCVSLDAVSPFVGGMLTPGWLIVRVSMSRVGVQPTVQVLFVSYNWL